MEFDYKKAIKKIKSTPGVYRFYDAQNKLLYIGKAIDLKKRVSQYFLRPQDERISQMVAKIVSVKTSQTDTNIEALILEANLINKHKPPYNILLKDDKTFGGIFITDEKYPRVYSARITDQLPTGEWFGPYVSGNQLKIALKVLRRIFKWCDQLQGGSSKIQDTITPDLTIVDPRLLGNRDKQYLNSKFILKSKIINHKSDNKSCFYHHINLCSGACVGAVTKQEYNRQIKHLKMFLRGEKNKLIKIIEKEMKLASREQKFEQAQKLKQELDGLKYIRESAFVVTGESPITKSKSNLKIECYDIANIGNDSIVGAIVVFIGNEPDNQQYRQFKIKTLKVQNDVGAMVEMVARRLKHPEWKCPDLLLIDGGIGHISTIRQILHKKNLVIPIVGISKGIKRNKNKLVGDVSFLTSQKIPLKTLVQARDEAHRFARRYFFHLRKKVNIDDNNESS